MAKKGENKSELAPIGSIIKKLRHDGAISQEELAKKAGLSQSAITQIENAHRDPTCGTLKAIAKALKVPSAKLISEADTIVLDLKELKSASSAKDLDPQTFKDLFLLSQEIDRLKITR